MEKCECNDNVVSRLSEEQRQLFSKLRNKKMKDWETFSDPDYISLWKGIIEKYPETAHFIYELIQNADDALATEVKIFLYKDKLVFIHNGRRHFSLTDCNCREGQVGDINAITSVANSTKKDDERTIGKFGVGFKSVFQYTDTPAIYDDTFWFKIENYIVPTLLEADHALRNVGETLFELPFKDSDKGFTDILQRLQNLNMPVLFLPNVQKITWRVDGDDSVHEYYKETIQSNQSYGIDYDFCHIHDYKEDRLIYLFHRNCDTSEGVYNVSVGYYLKKDGSLDIDAKGQIYCFFPTSECFESCFVSHAPFLLVDNRDSIKRYETVNLEFLHKIAELASDALLCLRDIRKVSNLLINDNIYYILNIKDTKSEVDDRNVYLKQCFLNVVRANKLILNKSEEYANLNEVYSTTKELESLLSSAQLRQLCGNDSIDFIYLKDCRSDFRDVEQSLEISSFNNRTLANRLSTSFMEKQTEEWTDRLLTYIEENAVKLWRTNDKRKITENWYGVKLDNWSSLSFRFAPIAKIQSGEWTAPYTLDKEKVNVCLPYEGYEDAGVDAFGKVLDNTMFENHEAFYRGIGLKEPDMADYIEKTLLVRYENDEVAAKDSLLKDFKYIFSLLNANVDTRIKGVLKKKWKLKKQTETGITLCNIGDMFLPSKDFVIFVNGNVSFNFIDCDFYAEGTGLSYDEVYLFLKEEFDIKDRPWVIPVVKLYCWWKNDDLPQSVFDFLEEVSLSQSYSPKFKDFVLYGYNIENCSEEWSHILWKYVVDLGIEKYANGTLEYTRYRERNYHEKKLISSYLNSLKNDRWIVDKNGVQCRPSEISLSDFHELGYQASEFIEQQLDFWDKVQSEKIKEEQRIKDEKENNKRAEELKNIEAKGVPSSTIHSFSKAMDAGINVEKLMNTAVIAKKKGVDFEAVLARSVETNSSDCNNSDSIMSDMSVYNSDSPQYHDTELPQEITSNIAPLMEIAQTVGSDNLPYVAEHVDDLMNLMLDEKPTNMARRIISYIGKKIYEQYLVNDGIKYEVVDDGLSGCDYNINNGEKYVSVVSTKKSIADNKIPVGISAAQNAFLRSHPNAQIRIVRISLIDISILSQYERIIGIYGNEDEPTFNDRLRKECDELAANYWKGADIGEFDAVSPEYSIKVERKNKQR